ncbi:MAG: YlxR family protein [Anaerolineae bacterium]|nr:YlxR family protein [Anaerolineae bacterium]
MVRKKQSKVKHMPQRTCVACRTVRAKRELVRIVNPGDGHVLIDESGKLNGRGAYLCAAKSCWELALKTGALHRALRMSLTANDQSVLRLYADSFPDNVGQ